MCSKLVRAGMICAVAAGGSAHGQCAEFERVFALDPDHDDEYGQSVSLDGGWLVVGAHKDDDSGVDAGSVYLLQSTPSGFAQNSKLIASDALPGDQLGFECCISGDAIVVGAPFRTGAFSLEGAAFVFGRDDGSEVALIDPNNRADRFFGWSVAIEGNTAIVGAVDPTSAGEVLVYERNRGGFGNWGLHQVLVPSDGAIADAFGVAVAISGDVLVVGSPNVDDEGDGKGAAYVFERDGSGVWIEQQKVFGSSVQIGDGFGSEVAVDGSTFVVGVPRAEAEGGGTDSGEAFVFERVGTSWIEQANLQSTSVPVGSGFGTSVAIEGDVIAIGFRGYRQPAPSLVERGAVEIFTRDLGSGEWGTHHLFSETGVCATPRLGESVTLDGGIFVAGGPEWEDNPCLAVPTIGYAITGEPCPCPADIDEDDCVGFTDLLSVIGLWGPCIGCPADINCDDNVSFTDLLAVLNAWGDCPCTSGCGTEETLEEVKSNAGLSQADWDTLMDCMENGTQAEQENCACWLQHYLEDCVPSCPNLPDCPDGDPLSKH